jgi:hypothetical protein
MKTKKFGYISLMLMLLSQIAYSQNSETVQPVHSETYLSRGGVFIEPLIFYSAEDSSVHSSQLPIINDDTSGNSNGYGLGFRVGGHAAEILLIGLDARYANMKNDDSFYKDADVTVYNLAPVVILQTPFLGVRLLAGYVALGESNPSRGSQGIDLKFTEGTGPRLGAGVYVGPVSLNLEYQDLTYNKTEIESFGSVAVNSATNIDTTVRGYTLSLSFPIEL